MTGCQNDLRARSPTELGTFVAQVPDVAGLNILHFDVSDLFIWYLLEDQTGNTPVRGEDWNIFHGFTAFLYIIPHGIFFRKLWYNVASGKFL